MKSRHPRSVRKLVYSVSLLVSLFAPLLQAPPAAAAPAQEPAAGGTITVSFQAGGNLADSVLSLPEAILIANGGTSATGLNRPLTVGEIVQLSGCTFNASGNITGGCGAGQPDTIVFTLLSPGQEIQLNSELPPLNDTAPTTIDGTVGNILPTIVRKPVYSFAYTGLTINSSNNVIKGIGFEGDSCGNACGMQHGVAVNGNLNQLSNVWVWKAQVDGIRVTGDSNVLDGLKVGVGSSSDALCHWALPAYKGNGDDGLSLTDTANSNTVKNSWIGCNGDYGIEVMGSGNTLGPNNRIGTNTAGTGLLGNSMSGALVYGDATTIVGNTVAYNSFTGLNVSGSNNTIDGNRIAGNADSGVALVTDGNLIPQGNKLVGNWIGTLDSMSATPNATDGILLLGAHNNQIGHPASPPNIIGGNLGNGVRLTNGAYNNWLVNNYIGVTPGLGAALPNGLSGVRLDGGAHDNQIGLAGSTGKNYIDFSGLNGATIAGSGTANNTFVNNVIYGNSGHGVLIADGASENKIGGSGQFVSLPNLISNNAAGVRVETGAHHNIVDVNNIANNTYDGIIFAGANTAHNQVAHAYLHHNGLFGIREIDGAANNWWTQLSSHDNTGEGIWKQAAMAAPVIASAGASNGQVTVQGAGGASTFLISYQVELYKASGDGEGLQYLGSAFTNANGAWSITFSGAPDCFTAFQTWYSPLTGARASSVFATTYCAQAGQQGFKVYVPIVVR